MTVNKIRIRATTGDTNIVIPIATTFDESMGKSDALNLWDLDQVQNNINPILDFETERFSPRTIGPNFKIFYSLLFATQPQPTGTLSDYSPDYTYVGITYPDIKDRKNNFIKSFFKFDFYGSPETTGNKVFFSIILPINNGTAISRQISNNPADPNYDSLAYQNAYAEDPLGAPYFYDVESSNFEFSSVGKSKENYYIQWLKNDFVIPNIDFYMSCKFFNASSGKIHRFINKPQQVTQYTLKGRDFFYYRIRFDRSNYTYKFYEYNDSVGMNGAEVGGTTGTPIEFVEYINP
jgi:hypothetical protein